MRIGLPREIKDGECRVALTPNAVENLKSSGHRVFVQKSAGVLSGFQDGEYRDSGARLLNSPAEVWKESELIVKIKELQPSEFKFLSPGKILFCYLHLAANLPFSRALIRSGVSAIACETIQDGSGKLPLLEPMSEIAGRMAAIVGAYHQAAPLGGRGTLISGLPGVLPAHVVIVGGGTVGENAAKIASGMGAQVTILDSRHERLHFLDEILPKNVSTLISTPENIAQAVASADIIIGAVLIPGAKAPKLITKKMLRKVPKGALFVDVSIDQGGISDTSRPTSHSHPTYMSEGVLHYCVPNMPGAYGRSATMAFTNAILPYLLKLADQGLEPCLSSEAGFAQGLNVYKGGLVLKEASESLGIPYTPSPFILQSPSA